MQPPTTEEVIERYNRLPNVLKEAITGDDITYKMADLGEKYGLNIEKTGDLAAITGYVILGVLPPRAFIETLSKDLGVDRNTASNIALEVNQKVFAPLRDALHNAHNIDVGEEEIRKGGMLEINVHRPAPIATIPSKPIEAAPMTRAAPPPPPSLQKTSITAPTIRATPQSPPPQPSTTPTAPRQPSILKTALTEGTIPMNVPKPPLQPPKPPTPPLQTTPTSTTLQSLPPKPPAPPAPLIPTPQKQAAPTPPMQPTSPTLGSQKQAVPTPPMPPPIQKATTPPPIFTPASLPKKEDILASIQRVAPPPPPMKTMPPVKPPLTPSTTIEPREPITIEKTYTHDATDTSVSQKRPSAPLIPELDALERTGQIRAPEQRAPQSKIPPIDLRGQRGTPSLSPAPLTHTPSRPAQPPPSSPSDPYLEQVE